MVAPGPSEVPPHHSRPSGRAFRPLPPLWEGLPTLCDGFQTTPGPPGLPPDYSQPSKGAY